MARRQYIDCYESLTEIIQDDKTDPNLPPVPVSTLTPYWIGLPMSFLETRTFFGKARALARSSVPTG